jgi:hypothetical protein
VAALCGLLAAAVAMGVAQLLAGIAAPNSSPVDAVGSVAINHTPLPVKVWATTEFGTNDKTLLLLGVFVVVFLYAMAVGVLAARRMAYGYAGTGAVRPARDRGGGHPARGVTRVRAANGFRRAGRCVRAVPADRGR